MYLFLIFYKFSTDPHPLDFNNVCKHSISYKYFLETSLLSLHDLISRNAAEKCSGTVWPWVNSLL